MIDEHLDVHPDDYPIMMPMVGKVTAVFAKDHPENPSGEITLYQVDVYPQSPAMTVSLPFVPAKGQLTGGANEQEDPLLVGQAVIVAFLEGDPNRPYIDGRWFDGGSTELAETNSEHPKVSWTRNGVGVFVAKNGTFDLYLAEDQSFILRDSDANVLFTIRKSGGIYEVDLGGNTGLKTLITEDLINLYNLHVHPDPTSGSTGVPTVQLTSAVATTVTKAK